MTFDPLQPLLDRRGIVLLDGGLATELERRGADLADPLWSGRVLLEEPELVVAVHDAYLEAGADVLTTATYQVTFEGLERRGLDRASAGAVMQRAVDLAGASVERFVTRCPPGDGLRPLVAASMGPYGAFLVDGSEYRGDYDLDARALADFHRPRAQRLAASGADLLAFETIPCLPEAEALAIVLEELPDARAWVAFSCRDERHVSSGADLADAISIVEGLEQVVAVGVNCVHPDHVLPLLEQARRVTIKPLVAYPNSGERYPGDGGWVGCPTSPDALVEHAVRWVEVGARLLGGCCRTGPEHVAALAAARATEVLTRDRPH